jgi:LysR family transcriptional regulator, low CO2-responsive transcriptional regulator
MHLTFRQLEVFEAVATCLSYTKAAEALFLSQPAVSMQVKQLEESIGLELFEKTGKRIALTAAGLELHRYARNVFQQLAEAEEAMEALKGVQRGRLNIAVASTVNYFAPRALAAFSRRYPGVTLKLAVSNRRTLIKRLEDNEIDLALMGQPPEAFASEPFMRNPLVVIAPPEHPLVGQGRISLQRLAEETFVMREPGSGTRAAMERFFEEQGLHLKAGMEMTRNEAIKLAVRAGMGLAIVSRHSLELELETKRLAILEVDAFPIERKWYLVHHRGKELSPSARAFQQFLLGEGLAECQCLEWAV